VKNWPLRWKIALYSAGLAVAATLAGAITTWFIMREAEIAAFDRRLTTDAQEFFGTFAGSRRAWPRLLKQLENKTPSASTIGRGFYPDFRLKPKQSCRIQDA